MFSTRSATRFAQQIPRGTSMSGSIAHIVAAALLCVGLAPLAATADDVAAVIPACPLLTRRRGGRRLRPPLCGRGAGALGRRRRRRADDDVLLDAGRRQAWARRCRWWCGRGRRATAALRGFLEALRPLAGEDSDRTAETLAIGDDALWDGDRVYVRKGGTSVTLATSLNALDPPPTPAPSSRRSPPTRRGRL